MEKRFTIEDFMIKAMLHHGNKYDYSKVNYINCDTKVIIICQIHGEFNITPYKFINRKQGCSSCGRINGAVKRIKTNDDVIKDFNKVHGDIYDYSKVNYTNVKKVVDIICPIHGVFKQTPDCHLSGGGCPKHHEPKCEKIIREYLIKNNYNYTTQKKYPDCRYKKPLSYDFYLPDFNMCIEYNGEQHYKSVKRWGGDKLFIVRQLRDEIKRKYCEKNNIKLLVIKHNENIVNILNSTFKSL